MSNITTTDKNKALMTPSHRSLATSVEASDIQIPKLLLMQGISNFVAEQRAAMGDWVDSIDATKLGDNKTPVKVIPICMWKDYVIMEKINGKFEFKEFKPYNSETQHWREFEHRDYVEGGVEHQRNFRMNFAVLLERDKKELGAFPYVLSFQRTGIKAGKTLANYFLKAQTKGQKPWFFTLGIGALLEKGDKGPYFVPTVASAIATPDLELVTETCETWETIFAQGSAKVDERDAATTEAGDSPAAGSETRF